MRAYLLLLALGLLAAGEATPATVRLPLAALGVQAGTSVGIDEAEVIADAAGLPVLLGRATRLSWISQGRKASHVVTAVDANSGDHTPDWAADEPKQEGDGWMVVGFGTSPNVPMAYERALLNARVTAARTGGTTTETEGPGGRLVRQTTSSMVSSGAPRDVVILVAIDAAQPVRCWVRLAARVEPAPAGPLLDAGTERAFEELDRKLQKDAAKGETP